MLTDSMYHQRVTGLHCTHIISSWEKSPIHALNFLCQLALFTSIWRGWGWSHLYPCCCSGHHCCQAQCPWLSCCLSPVSTAELLLSRFLCSHRGNPPQTHTSHCAARLHTHTPALIDLVYALLFYVVAESGNKSLLSSERSVTIELGI